MSSTHIAPKRRAARLLASVLAILLLASACTDSGTNDGEQADDAADATAPSVGSEAQPGTSVTDDESATPSTARPPVGEDDLGPFSGATGFSNSDPALLGNPIWINGPGNIPIKATNEVSIRFVANQDGTSDGASFIIKYDFERPNYHGGNCGQLQVSLRSDDEGVPSEDILTQLVIDDPCGGERSIGWLTDEKWQQPVSVAEGQTYHLVFSNLDPDPANFVSINVLYRPDDDPLQVGLSTGNGQLDILARGSEFWSGNSTNQWGASDVLGDHYPSFELHYEDGSSQGVSYVGARFGSEVVLAAGDPNHLRQVFPVQEDTTVTALWFRGQTASDDASVAVTIAELDGEVLHEGTLVRLPGALWFGAPLPDPIEFRADATYTVEIAAASGTIEVRPMYQAQHDDWTSTEQSDWAGAYTEIGGEGTWQNYFGELPHDLSLYFETDAYSENTLEPNQAAEPDDEAVVEPAATVAIYGDSLIGEPTFDDPLAAALAARNVELVGKDNDPGRDIDRLLTALDNNPLAADVYIVAIGINGGQTGADFEASVRLAVAKIRQINPDADILWTSLHALPVKQFIVDDRMIPRNLVLDNLEAEGLIDVIPWFEAASANPEIYGSDGVHFFGNEALYVETMVGSLDGWLEGQ